MSEAIKVEVKEGQGRWWVWLEGVRLIGFVEKKDAQVLAGNIEKALRESHSDDGN